MKKVCTRCKIEKDIEDFVWKNKSKNVRQSNCKECQKIWRKKHYQENKQYYKDNAKKHNLALRDEYRKIIYEHLKNNPCADCGENDIVVLEFDHVRGEKVANISDMATYPTRKLINEIKKCDVVCANCHRRRTYTRLGNGILTWFKNGEV